MDHQWIIYISLDLRFVHDLEHSSPWKIHWKNQGNLQREHRGKNGRVPASQIPMRNLAVFLLSWYSWDTLYPLVMTKSLLLKITHRNSCFLNFFFQIFHSYVKVYQRLVPSEIPTDAFSKHIFAAREVHAAPVLCWLRQCQVRARVWAFCNSNHHFTIFQIEYTPF